MNYFQWLVLFFPALVLGSGIGYAVYMIIDAWSKGIFQEKVQK